jgi:hypothetical protein
LLSLGDIEHNRCKFKNVAPFGFDWDPEDACRMGWSKRMPFRPTGVFGALLSHENMRQRPKIRCNAPLGCVRRLLYLPLPQTVVFRRFIISRRRFSVAIKIGINGFGRIGRMVFQAICDQGLLG